MQTEENFLIPKEVFHYTKNCSALKILAGKQLRLSQYGYTNDPRETKERLFLPTFDTTNYDYEIGDQIFQEVNRIIHKEWKVLCVTTNHPRLENAKSDREKKEIRATNPFLSGDARPRMWAQYAENHQGVCMKLNGERLNQKIDEQLKGTSTVFCKSIDYSDDKMFYPLQLSYSRFSNLIGTALTKELRKYVLEGWKEFLLKSNDWATEYEFRWIVHNNKDTSEYISIEGIIDEVMLGNHFPEDDKKLIDKLCRESGIKIGIMQWPHGTPNPTYGSIYEPSEFSQEAIPQDVKELVWNRDRGCCTKCGKQTDLEYIDIIPVSKGGTYTVSNLRLLCKKCKHEETGNLSKSQSPK